METNWKDMLERLMEGINGTGLPIYDGSIRDGFAYDGDNNAMCLCECSLPGEDVGGEAQFQRYQRREHTPDCPWRLAKEALQEWEDFPRFRVCATVPPGEPGPGWSAWNLYTEDAAGALVRDLHLNGLRGLPVCSIQFDELKPDGSEEFIYGFKYEPAPDGEGGYVPYIPDWVTLDWLPERPQRNAGIRRGFSGAASRD